VVIPSTGYVVLIAFPFTDLSATRLRPAVALADAGRGDWVLWQITSNPYSDPAAVEISRGDFASGALRTVSYARPGKLFTVNGGLVRGVIGELTPEAFRRVLDAVVAFVDPYADSTG
jgi:mRNA interferase MazF